MRRWVGEGILRRTGAEAARRPQLLVFGYTCRLFRDDERALHIDQGKHLIPCMGDETLKIDRYDARGALGAKELLAAEGCGNSSLCWERLTPAEQRAERLCDQERYRAIYCDEDEEEMYREEELKRIHMSQGDARYGQVEFNYDLDDSEKIEAAQKKNEEPSQPEDDEPFVAPPHLLIPEGMALPETKKLNTIVEKTASFIASQGTQMEILLKAKQSGNPQFDFLSIDCSLHPYYCFLLGAIKSGLHKIQEEDSKDEKTEEDDHYLHPSLAPMSVESAPSIPSISYKPSADCAYSMLVNQIKGTSATENPENSEDGSIASSDFGLAPPGTETVPLAADEKYYEMPPQAEFSNVPPEIMQMYYQGYTDYHASYNRAEISRAPVLYNNANEQYPYNPATGVRPDENLAGKETKQLDDEQSATNSPKPDTKASTGLKLIHYSDSESDNESDSGDNSNQSHQLLKIPPHDQQTIIDKMASYVARNGNDFEQIVKMKGDPRFSFLDTSHEFNPYYKHKRTFYERVNKKTGENKDLSADDMNNDEQNEDASKKSINDGQKVIVPVSFSIKKVKETEPMLPKPALPYESSGDEEENDNTESQEKIAQDPIIKVQPVIIEKPPPPKPIEPVPPKEDPKPEIQEIPKIEYKPKQYNQQMIYQIQPILKEQTTRTNSGYSNSSNTNNSSSHSDRRRRHSERRESSKKSPSYENAYDDYRRRKRDRKSPVRENNPVSTSDIITIDEENEAKTLAEFIDLTQECNDDDKYKLDGEDDNSKDSNSIQMDRKKRAAAFLSSLKSSSTTSTRLHNTLASAMVKTLHTLQNKREESSSRKRRKRDHSSSRKSKKKKSDRGRSGDRYPDDESNYRTEGDSWKQSRDSYKSRRDSRDSYSKKMRRKKSSRDDRSPTYYKKDKRNSEQDSPSLRRSVSQEKNILDEQYRLQKAEEHKLSRKQDELLSSSLKELVRETRKECISKEPIKMAVDIFANNTPNLPSDDEWEKDSNGENRNKLKNQSGSSSDSSKSSNDS